MMTEAQRVGRRICLTLAAEGALVAVNDLVAERAQKVAGEVRAAGGTTTIIPPGEARSVVYDGAKTVQLGVTRSLAKMHRRQRRLRDDLSR